MQTNVLMILLFSGIVLAIYYLIPIRYRVLFLAAVSALFYLLCDFRMFWLLILLAAGSWELAQKIETVDKKRKDRLYMAGILFAVFIFCLFKYFNFFAEETASLFSAIMGYQVRIAPVFMPLGLSYYILKVISYVTEVYWGKYKAERNIVSYFLYISFFPQVICGPIDRADNLLKQFHAKLVYQAELWENGIGLIISGVFKKAVIADRLVGYVDIVFEAPDAYPSLALWMAAFFYSIQLYCDFSGYSEIAIGIGNLFGITSGSNFEHPYFSENIKEFWRKWHISLSSWLRDYIYIPLGGSRQGKIRHKINLFLTFVVSGLWHGEQFHFLVWGCWHGILNILTPNRNEHKKGVMKFISIFLNFICVMFGWIMFRADTVRKALYFISRMFTQFSLQFEDIVASVLPFTLDYTCVAYLFSVLLFIGILTAKEWSEVHFWNGKNRVSSIWNMLLIICIVMFGVFGEASFLYAQF